MATFGFGSKSVILAGANIDVWKFGRPDTNM